MKCLQKQPHFDLFEEADTLRNRHKQNPFSGLFHSLGGAVAMFSRMTIFLKIRWNRNGTRPVTYFTKTHDDVTRPKCGKDYVSVSQLMCAL